MMKKEDIIIISEKKMYTSAEDMNEMFLLLHYKIYIIYRDLSQASPSYWSLSHIQ